jgi:hypothetical protein
MKRLLMLVLTLLERKDEEDEENSAWVQTNFGRVGYIIGLSGFHIYLKFCLFKPKEVYGM